MPVVAVDMDSLLTFTFVCFLDMVREEEEVKTREKSRRSMICGRDVLVETVPDSPPNVELRLPLS